MAENHIATGLRMKPRIVLTRSYESTYCILISSIRVIGLGVKQERGRQIATWAGGYFCFWVDS